MRQFLLQTCLLQTCLLAALLAVSASAAAVPVPLDAEAAPAAAAARSGTLSVDGVDYYYELHGQGQPLLLLHGGLGAGSMFGPVLERLAERNTVILVDLQGHGRTPLGERPFKIESMGDDMAALVQRLGYRQVDVMGYSLGGGVALRMAVQRPAQVGKLVLVSASHTSEAFYPEIRAMQKTIDANSAPMMRDTPMYNTYAAVAPKPEDFPRLLDAIGGLMRQSFDWSADVARLQGPVMLVYGDGDMYRPESEIAFYQLLGGGKRDAGWQRETLSKNRLAILPDATHYDIFASPRLVDAVAPFLAGRSDAKSWDAQLSGEKN
ncbi:alpha/beta fold hydrolase [Luteimonas aquatica]|uniref:alpha/beta fold hydrolase n=1 Tax=Luteimonas aquatica TaxID=450364 RepID=UPI001F5742D2|nr:alpha/beta hydrolase [Luteimonas aquatica]